MNDNLVIGIAIGAGLLYLWMRNKKQDCGCSGSSGISDLFSGLDAAGNPAGTDRNGTPTSSGSC